ncbi:MAG TPA: nucleotidyltransferase domain-containing protein [Anaerolineae bacterium]
MNTLTGFSIETLTAQLAEVLAHHPAVMLAYLFGSAATGLATPLSDIDIALVVAENQAAPHNRLKLELALADEIAVRCGLSQIDVRIVNEAPLVLRGQVVTDGILLFARDEDTRVEFETRTRSEYFDFLPVARQLRESFFDDIQQRGLYGQRA